MNTPPLYRPEWGAAEETCWSKEKELTRARDALAAERRRMPWVADREGVRRSRAQDGCGDARRPLRDGRGQLIVYHFMSTTPT